MRRRFAGSIAAVLVFSPMMLAQTSKPSEGEKIQAEPPALSHVLSGVWMQYPSGNGPGNPGMNGVDVRVRPPLTAWGQAKFDAAKPVVGPRAVPGEEGNPALRCEPDSPPKLLILPNPFEIVQIPDRVFMFFEQYHLWRTIWADGRELPKNPDPTWLGYSVGKWEGDTFVVDSIGFNDKVWVDGFGNPRSEQMHLTERYRRLNHDTLEMQIIMDEHNSYDEAVRKPAGVSPTRK